jgi:hypothetical protein
MRQKKILSIVLATAADSGRCASGTRKRVRNPQFFIFASRMHPPPVRNPEICWLVESSTYRDVDSKIPIKLLFVGSPASTRSLIFRDYCMWVRSCFESMYGATPLQWIEFFIHVFMAVFLTTDNGYAKMGILYTVRCLFFVINPHLDCDCASMGLLYSVFRISGCTRK